MAFSELPSVSHSWSKNNLSSRLTVILGASELWITEVVLTYDGQPSDLASIMEFTDGKVARETQCFSDPFEPGPSHAKWVERI